MASKSGSVLAITLGGVVLTLFLLTPSQREATRAEPCNCHCPEAVRVVEPCHETSKPNDGYGPKLIPPIRTRVELADIARAENLTVGLEIGVYRGLFASEMLERWTTVQTYHCLDAWKHQENYVDIANKNQKQFNDLFAETKNRLDKWSHKVHYHRAFSNEAVGDFEDESIDLIYIDARHDYKGVKEDMELYWPKLRKGGIFAGHDFLDQIDLEKPDRMKKGHQKWDINGDGTSSHGKAVRAAVLEFSSSVHRQVAVAYEDLWPSWYFRK